MAPATRRTGTTNAMRKAKNKRRTKSVPEPVICSKSISTIPLLTTSTNLTSDFIGNITKTNKENKLKTITKVKEKTTIIKQDNQEVDNAQNKKGTSKHTNKNEIEFNICEDSRKSADIKTKKNIPLLYSEVEVREQELTAVSDLSTPQSIQQAGQLVPSVTANMTINHNEWAAYQNKVFMDHERTLVLLDQYVKNEMFHHLKFISNAEMMIFSWEENSICQIVCTKFNVSKNNRVSFWTKYTKYIIQKLNKKRSDVSNAMRKSFKGKCVGHYDILQYLDYLTLPVTQDLLEKVNDNFDNNDFHPVMPEKNIVNNCRQTYESYCEFASSFIAPVVGKRRFDNLCWRSTFSSYVTISDEAFALLTFENNYD